MLSLESDTAPGSIAKVLNAAALFALLFVAMSWIGSGFFTVDENAYRSQSEYVEATGEWMRAYPTDGVLAQSQFPPLSLSLPLEDGWIAYERHPAYVVGLVGFLNVFGERGPVLASTLSAVVFAAAIARMAQSFSGIRWEYGFWGAALLTPMFFHAFVLWAHAPAAALTAVALAMVVSPPASAGRYTVLALAAAGTVMLRTEGLFAIAGIMIAASLMEAGRRQRLITVGVLGSSATAAYLVDRMLASTVRGAEKTSLSAAALDTSSGIIDSRVSAAVTYLLDPGGAGGQVLLRLLVVLLLATAVYLTLRGGPPGAPVLLCGVATLAAVASFGQSASYNGLLPAFPALVLVPFGWSNRTARAGIVGYLAVTVMLIATIKPDAGGLGWGGRYGLVALPLLAPAVFEAVKRLPSVEKGVAIGAAVLVATVAIQVSGLSILRSSHGASSRASEEIGTTLLSFRDSEVPLIAPDIRVGRGAPDAAVNVPLMSLSDVDQLPDAIAIVDDAQLDQFLLVRLNDFPETELPAGWERTARSDGGFLVVETIDRTDR